MSSVQESPNTPQDDAVQAHSGSIYSVGHSSNDSVYPSGYHHGISVLEYPFPRGLTYIFYWSSDGKLSYHVGNLIQGGSNNYKTHTISVNRGNIYNQVSISHHQQNAPLASALTSDGNIHLFYSDNSEPERTLTELIFDPNRSTWNFGPLTKLGLKVHLNSGIGAWSEPILKVVIHASADEGRITEAWWDTVNGSWKFFVIR